jgi:hypothetical protein
MDPEEPNDVTLRGDVWKGPFKDKFWSPDPVAACWVLTAVLIHEGQHQDDDYVWPPPGPTTGNPVYPCEELANVCGEIRTLCEALAKIATGTLASAHVTERKDWLEAGKDPGGNPGRGTKPFWEMEKTRYAGPGGGDPR